MKTLVLWAIALMLRPSDIAPKSLRAGSESWHLHTFTLDQVHSLEDGSLEILSRWSDRFSVQGCLVAEERARRRPGTNRLKPRQELQQCCS